MRSVILSVFGCFLFAFAAAAETCVKTFRTTEDPPFTYSSKDAPNGVTGIDADTVRVVLEMIGCEISFLEMPWARALVELRQGRVDIISGAFDTPERRQFAYFADQGSVSPNVLFMRTNDVNRPQISSFADFLESDLVLGGQIDVNYGPEYWQAKQSSILGDRLRLLTQRELLWHMLERGRIDAVVANFRTGLMEINQQGYADQITSTGIELSSAPSFIIFSKASNDEEFVARFNTAHRTIIENGVLQTIVDTHTLGVTRVE